MTLDALIKELTALRDNDQELGHCEVYASQQLGAYVMDIQTVRDYDGIEIYLYGKQV